MLKVHELGRIKSLLLGWSRYLMHVVRLRGRGKVSLILSRIFVGKSTVLVPLRTGGKMVLDFGNKHEVVMYFDLFAKDISTFLEAVLNVGDIFVDCGANVGYFSFFAGPIVGKSGRVIAIDANPYCVRRIEESKSSGKHKNIEIIGVALGQCEGTISFNLAKDPMYSSICDTDKLAWTGKQEAIDVKVDFLDKILEGVLTSTHKKIRLLKLDVEGAEILAMRGAKNLLQKRKIDYIYVELHPIQLKLLGQDVNEFHSFMKEQGYCANSIGGSNLCFVYSSPEVSMNVSLS